MGKHPVAVTMRVVAEHCGVSLATASKAFNPRSEDIGAATRERILAAARELGFQPDRSTSQRARKRWQNIGLAWGRAAPRGDGIYAELCETLARTIKPWGYHLLFTPVEDAADWRLMQRSQRLDGVVVVETMADEVLAELEASGYPAVLLNLPTSRKLPRIAPDDRGGSAQLVEHLAALGHRQIAYVPRQASTSHVSEDDRWAGVRDAAASAGVAVVRAESPLVIAGVQAGRLTAAITYSHREALQLLPLVHAAGLSVPGDLSIAVGSDVPCLAHTHPPLTSLEIPIPAMARQAVTLLVDLIELTAPPPTQLQLAKEEICLRASTGKPGERS